LIDKEQKGAVAQITLNRPHQRNAMNAELVSELLAGMAAFEADTSVGAILLCGSGKGFCAGSDLTYMASMSAAERRGFERDSGRLGRRIGQCVKPVIAAVHGFAIGGGLTLAASCDLVVTRHDSVWSLPEVPIDLFPAWGLASVVAKVGKPRARLLTSGVDSLDGQQAHPIGLADYLIDGNVVEDGLARAQSLAALPRRQAETTKPYFAADFLAEASDDAALDLFLAMTDSPEAARLFAARRLKGRP
jgi:enoyl-CoA hydratase/carnithine racemase